MFSRKSYGLKKNKKKSLFTEHNQSLSADWSVQLILCESEKNRQTARPWQAHPRGPCWHRSEALKCWRGSSCETVSLLRWCDSSVCLSEWETGFPLRSACLQIGGQTHTHRFIVFIWQRSWLQCGRKSHSGPAHPWRCWRCIQTPGYQSDSSLTGGTALCSASS